jgi:mRNA interferase MazF
MTDYKRQDIVLINFGFSDGTGFKKRPALIISSDSYHSSRREIIVAAITSNIKIARFADTKIEQWKEAGLLMPSLVTGVIRTMNSDLVVRKLGALSHQDFSRVEKNIAKAMGLAEFGLTRR